MADGDYIPLKLRFKTWWDGASHRGQSCDASKSLADANIGEEIEIDRPVNGAEWTEERVAAAQLVWGKGQVHPGGDAYLGRMMKGVRIDDKAMVLDLTAGLGAAARALPDLKNCEVRSFDTNEALSKAALESYETEVEPYELDLGGFSRKGLGNFAGILVRDLLFATEKTEALRELSNMLLPEGFIVISDFVAAEEADDTPDMKKWRAIEPLQPDLWTVEQYRNSILSLKLDVKLLADETDAIYKIVKTSWNNCLNNLKSERLSRGMVDALAYEAELWLHRMRA